MEEIGRRSAELLLQAIRNKAKGKPRCLQLMIPTRFIERGSCRELPLEAGR